MSERRKRKRSGYEHYEQRSDDKKRIENIDSGKFEFVQMDEKIHDKKFETKPIGYFRDAMTRFAKNKTNVTATIILFTLILLSIFVPAFTTKNIERQIHEIRFLPPRVPYLERLGVFDGMERIEEQPVDRDTIDPETGIGLPYDHLYDHDYIDMDTLENFERPCTALDPSCYGGWSVFGMVVNAEAVTRYSPAHFDFDPAENPMLHISISDITEGDNTVLNIFTDPDGSEDYVKIAEITETGVHEIDINEALPDLAWAVSTNLKLELRSDNEAATVSIDSIKLYDDSDEDPIVEDEGYQLATYSGLRGDNILRFTEAQEKVVLRSHEEFPFDWRERAEHHFEISVDDISEDGDTRLKVYVDPDQTGDYVLLDTLTEAGVHEVDLLGSYADGTYTVLQSSSHVRLELVSDLDDAFAVLKRVELFRTYEREPDEEEEEEENGVPAAEGEELETVTESVQVHEGPRLARYEIETGEASYMISGSGGEYYRRGSARLYSSFNYDRYAHAFGDRQETYSALDYYDLVEEYGDACEPLEDPDNPEGWLFPEECPFVRVINQTERVAHPSRQIIGLQDGYTEYAIRTRVRFPFDLDDNPHLHFNVVDVVGENTALNIYLAPEGDDYVQVGSITETGLQDFYLTDALDGSGTFSSRLKLKVVSDTDEGAVTIRRIRYHEESEEDPVWIQEGDDFVSNRYIDFEGYEDQGRVTYPEFYSYNLVLNYKRYMGFDAMPYYFFGTTGTGRDLFAMTMLGLRTSLFIGVAVSMVNIAIGIIYGAIEGYYGGKVDLLMERFAEVVGRIPWLVTLSIMVALLGPGVLTLFILLIFSGWVGISGITRTQFYRFKNREYVLASRTMGAKDSRLIFRHILPNAIGTIITMSILSIPLVIFTESTISYLGFGIGHGTDFTILGVRFSGVSIGVLLADGRAQMYARPYLTVFPAIIISILMITFNMFGNALRDAFNPSLRGVE